MLTDPAISTGAIGVYRDIFGGEIAVVRRTLVFVVEVVAAHDAGEAVVVGQGERLGTLVTSTILATRSNAVVCYS